MEDCGGSGSWVGGVGAWFRGSCKVSCYRRELWRKNEVGLFVNL